MSKKKLFLLDGMALAYRAHFAFINSRLKNSEGIPTGPILGFANTVEKMLEEDKPTHIAVAWIHTSLHSGMKLMKSIRRTVRRSPKS